MNNKVTRTISHKLPDKPLNDPNVDYETKTWFETPADSFDDALYLNLPVAVFEAEYEEIDTEVVEILTEIEKVVSLHYVTLSNYICVFVLFPILKLYK